MRWIHGRLRRYALDRRELVREGSRVVTPVIQFTKGLGPTSIIWGSDEENQRYLQEQSDKWLRLRDALMVYVNHHPREAVRTLGEEVEQAVSEDLKATAWLLMNRKSEVGLASYTRSDQAHAKALAKAEELMREIRRY